MLHRLPLWFRRRCPLPLAGMLLVCCVGLPEVGANEPERPATGTEWLLTQRSVQAVSATDASVRWQGRLTVVQPAPLLPAPGFLPAWRTVCLRH